MAVRLSVGLFFGLLSGCVTAGQAALSPNTLQTACEGGDAQSCRSLGLQYEEGRGVPKDESRAATLFEKACTGGEAQGCYLLGVLYQAGLGVPQDERHAATLWEKACRAGISEACAGR
jgi:TPR repeat protein